MVVWEDPEGADPLPTQPLSEDPLNPNQGGVSKADLPKEKPQ